MASNPYNPGSSNYNPRGGAGQLPMLGGQNNPMASITPAAQPATPDLNSMYGSDIMSYFNDPNWRNSAAGKQFFAGMGLNPSGRYEIKSAVDQAVAPTLYNYLSKLGFQNSMLPEAQGATSQLVNMLANPDRMAADANARNQAQAQSGAQQMLQAAKAGGMGIGQQQGIQQEAINQANTASNQDRAQMNSGQGMLSNLQAILQAIMSQNPDMNNLNSIAGIDFGTPRNSTGMDVLGNVLGGMAGNVSIPLKGGVTI
jgi:hypothetical protein